MPLWRKLPNTILISFSRRCLASFFIPTILFCKLSCIFKRPFIYCIAKHSFTLVIARCFSSCVFPTCSRARLGQMYCVHTWISLPVVCFAYG